MPERSLRVRPRCSPRRADQLAEAGKQQALGQEQVAAALSVSVAPVSEIELGEITSFECSAKTR